MLTKKLTKDIATFKEINNPQNIECNIDLLYYKNTLHIYKLVINNFIFNKDVLNELKNKLELPNKEDYDGF